MEPILSIITVNYNGIEDTCSMIESLPYDDATMEIIVVDNGSRVNEAEIIETKYPYVKTIRSKHNLGFAGGNNIGIKESKGKYLFLINNDTLVEKEWHIEKLIGRLESDNTIAIVCPKIRFSWEPKAIQFAGYTKLSAITLRNRAIGYGENDNGQYETPHPTPYAHGAAMLVNSEAIRTVGLMPECYFLYYEELDWSLMFTRSGYSIWYDPSVVVFHKESATTGKNSQLKTYYMTRNRLLFAKRNINKRIRPLTYIYIIGVVTFRDIFLNRLKGKRDLADAATHAFRTFFGLSS